MCIGFFHVLFLEFGELQGICYTGKNGKGIFQSLANGAFDIVIGVTEKSLDNQLIIEGFLFSYTLDN